jgi:predicted anti-sigma-YlaC factor YlaD
MRTNDVAVLAATCFVTLLAFSTASPGSAANDALAAEPGHVNPVVAKRKRPTRKQA